jgi:hypothetical protein
MPEKRKDDPDGLHSDALKPDELIERLIPDPSNPDVKRITGFLMGNSDREGYWRLYLTVNLNHYIEFRKEETLYAHQFRPGRTVIWIKPGSRIHEMKARSAPVEFLQGQVRRGFLRGVSGITQVMDLEAGCPGSGCAHCSVACSQLPGGEDTIGYTCGC